MGQGSRGFSTRVSRLGFLWMKKRWSRFTPTCYQCAWTLNLFLSGFISSLPQLAWEKRLCCCCCCMYSTYLLALSGLNFETYVVIFKSVHDCLCLSLLRKYGHSLRLFQPSKLAATLCWAGLHWVQLLFCSIYSTKGYTATSLSCRRWALAPPSILELLAVEIGSVPSPSANFRYFNMKPSLHCSWFPPWFWLYDE